MAETKIPDSTPGLIAMYALGDEQALLAKLRYNRLIDIFTEVTCYSLQSHLRTTVPSIGQVETNVACISFALWFVLREASSSEPCIVPTGRKGGIPEW
ncbi:MAG TPA: hypothetical protein VKV40_22220 [Ktedonobacteraceae bacterium]|nr:hypothetical protein [Ktedonobacteraceae bacterium]